MQPKDFVQNPDEQSLKFLSSGWGGGSLLASGNLIGRNKDYKWGTFQWANTSKIYEKKTISFSSQSEKCFDANSRKQLIFFFW